MLRIAAALALTLSLSVWFSSTSSASPSAKRDPGVSFQTMAARYRADNLKKHGPYFRAFPETSAMDASVAIDKVDKSLVPAWKDEDTLKKAFTEIRDKRFLPDDEHPSFLRRMSWLYPDDGCFARAELAAQELKKAGQTAPAKIFAFGNLEVETKNTASGDVSWWYHVVVGYRSGETIFVFDPAIEPERPLTLTEWTDRMGGNEARITVSVCKAETYEPDSSCSKGKERAPGFAIRDQNMFLPLEWERVESMGLEPEKVLGDEPPWLKAANILPLR